MKSILSGTFRHPRATRAVVLGALLAMAGCEGLHYSAAGEGTGFQIIGALVVLAKYHAKAH